MAQQGAPEGSQGDQVDRGRIESHIKHQLLQGVDEQSSYICGLCVTPGFGPSYNCSSCEMRIHRYCASRLQLNRPCFLHPDKHNMSLEIAGGEGAVLSCKACNGVIAGAHYRCDWEGREVRIHPLCFLLRFAPDTATRSGQRLLHELHRKHLVSWLYSPVEYVCSGCGSAGMGRRLRCSKGCDFALHPYCSSCIDEKQPCFLCSPTEAAHGIGVWTAMPSWKGKCHFCNGEISRTETAAGMHYWCEVSKLVAHPLCGRLRQLEKMYTQNTPIASQNPNAHLCMESPDAAGKVIDAAGAAVELVSALLNS